MVGQYEAVCLAFGAESAGSDLCTSGLSHLNSLLHEARQAVGMSGAQRCPLMACTTTVTCPVLISTHDKDQGSPAVASAAIAGAIVTCRQGMCFHILHPGGHAPLHDTQFQITRMQGGNIAEVKPAGCSVARRRPSCTGTMSAADWCRACIASATTFEKMAIQRALGVGLLRRACSAEDDEEKECSAGEQQHFEDPDSRAPAEACFSIREVDDYGCVHLMHTVDKAIFDHVQHCLDVNNRGERRYAQRRLQAGDVCDIRAVGSLAAVQAEDDAFACFRSARLRLSLETGRVPSSAAQSIKGCLATAAMTRFGGCSTREACASIMDRAARAGECAVAGAVVSKQVVSVDNRSLACDANTCLATLFVCEDKVH